jgi:ribonuclease T2
MCRSIVRGMVVLFLLLVAEATLALAQAVGRDRTESQTSQFDFYVLSLSWSPSLCAEAGERAPWRGRSGPECGTHAYSFIVHGLWPQYERGYPENCLRPAPRLNRAIVSAMLDLMVSPRLVYSEWDRHGTCSGLSARAYFETVREARARITIPPQYLNLHQPLSVSPEAVAEAFIKANPGLTPEDIAIDCVSGRLTEVRLCLAKDLKFRACPQVVKRSCRSRRLLMPPPHGVATGGGGSG